jgi:hypothetical protein
MFNQFISSRLAAAPPSDISGSKKNVALRSIDILRKATYFDKVGLRMAAHFTRGELNSLRANARFVDIRPGRPIRGSDQHLLLTITGPRPEAIKILDQIPNLSINYLEPALDIILVDHPTILVWHELFNVGFVQPWHGSKQTVQFDRGTYRGPRKPGKNYNWYSDKPDRIFREPNCLHLEGRHQGMAAIRRLGIRTCNDLLSFDFSRYWQSNLRLFDLDLGRLGRFHNNRSSGQRRRAEKITVHGRRVYNVDYATGCVLFRNRGAHRNQEARSVQQFVDSYGRGARSLCPWM